MSSMKVYIIAAVSTDGFIAKSKDEVINWTSKEDKRFFKDMTKKSGVMVMGGNTYRTFSEPLPGRRHIVYTRSGIDNEAFEKTNESPKDLVKRLEGEGFDEIAIIGGGFINSLFLDSGLVTDVYLTVEPLVFGGGVKVFHSPSDARLRLHSVKKLNDSTVLMHYKA